MKVVMEVCKERGMFFLDSRTNSKSVCKSVASEYGVKLYERNTFLDNTPSQADMIAMFKSGIEVAKKNGSVIMIGHVWSGKNLADVLQKNLVSHIQKNNTRIGYFYQFAPLERAMIPFASCSAANSASSWVLPAAPTSTNSIPGSKS